MSDMLIHYFPKSNNVEDAKFCIYSKSLDDTRIQFFTQEVSIEEMKEAISFYEVKLHETKKFLFGE